MIPWAEVGLTPSAYWKAKDIEAPVVLNAKSMPESAN